MVIPRGVMMLGMLAGCEREDEQASACGYT